MKNKNNKFFKNTINIVNLVIILIGIILCLLPLIDKIPKCFHNILLSVGCSLIATAIASFITSVLVMSSNEIKEIINNWRLKSIYKTKQEMNNKSNQYLDNAKESIDIIATGMSNFLSYKGKILREKSMSGVKIRIISCNNFEMLKQREKDEAIDPTFVPIGIMEKEVRQLSSWVQQAQKDGCKIELKYHNSYPGFSYLRIDSHVFFGANLPLIKSQQNFAFEFQNNGEGGIFLNSYFNDLWENKKICSNDIDSNSKSKSQKNSESI